jgi:hypothetical protein
MSHRGGNGNPYDTGKTHGPGDWLPANQNQYAPYGASSQSRATGGQNKVGLQAGGKKNKYKRGGACCKGLPEEFIRVKAPTPSGNFLFKNYGSSFRTSGGGKIKRKRKTATTKLQNALKKLRDKVMGKKRKSTGRKRRKRRQKGGDDAMGATYMPMRWYNANWGASGKGVPAVAPGWKGASCMTSAYGPIVGRSFPRTNLAPFPNVTGQQTGGKKHKRKPSGRKTKRKRKRSKSANRKTKRKRKSRIKMVKKSASKKRSKHSKRKTKKRMKKKGK